MALKDEHKQLAEKKSRIRKMRAVIGGEDVLKGEVGEFDPTEFLPPFIPEDKARYEQYLLRAVFYGYTGWTQQGLLGSVFRKPTKVELPAGLSYLIDDVTGASQTLEDFAKKVTKENLSVARLGLLTEYPKTDKQITKEEEIKLGNKASIKFYSPESIYNWEEKVINGKLTLVQVRLKETKTEVIDFEEKTKTVYRVLSLVDGVYTQTVYNKKDEIIEGPLTPTKYNGDKFNEIPFTFIGAEDNTATIDKPPLLDIANINLGHYRNSADKEENLYQHGQGTVIISSDMNTTDWLKANPGGMKIGSRNGHFIGPNGTALLLQLKETNAYTLESTAKVQQMVGIGARFIQDKSGNQTAEAAKIGAKQQESGLSVVVSNCSAGIKKCIGWCAEFMGIEGIESILFELNKDFFDADLTAQEIAATILLEEGNYIAKSDVQYLLKESGILRGDRKEEDIEEENSSKPPISDGL